MLRALRIAVVGYGTAGQALAVLLGADGHQLEVFERAAAPGPVGAGFLLQPSGLQVLWNMGLLPQALAHGAWRAGAPPVWRHAVRACGDGHAVPRSGYAPDGCGHAARRVVYGAARGLAAARATACGYADHRDRSRGRARAGSTRAMAWSLRPDHRRRWLGLHVACAGAGNAAGSRVSMGGAVVPVAARRLALCGPIASALYRRTQDDRPVAGGHAPGRRHAAAEFFLEPAVQRFRCVGTARHCRLARRSGADVARGARAACHGAGAWRIGTRGVIAMRWCRAGIAAASCLPAMPRMR